WVRSDRRGEGDPEGPARSDPRARGQGGRGGGRRRAAGRLRDRARERLPRRRRRALAATRGRAAERAGPARRPVRGAQDRGDGVVISELCDRTGADLAAGLAAGEISALDLVESALARVEEVDDRIH